MDYNICTMIEGILNIWTEKGVIHYDLDAMLMCYRSYCPDIDQIQGWIAGRFDPDKFCLWSDKSCDIQFDTRRESNFDAMGCSYFRKVSMCTTVHVRD